jgi:hypothetical protein
MFFRAKTAMPLPQAADAAVCWDPCGLFISRLCSFQTNNREAEGALRREKRYGIGSPDSTLSGAGGPGG